MLQTLAANQWKETFSAQMQMNATTELENGQIIFFPNLSFQLNPQEKELLSPHYADPHTKNISYYGHTHKLWGVQYLSDEKHAQLKHMLERYAKYATQLCHALFPRYASKLIVGRTSYRPVQISNRKTSFRKDDKLLHIDAFPSAPNQGKRILRIFSNINPQGKARIWRTGEHFEAVAKHFKDQLKKPLLGACALLRFLRITKSYRTLYDHYMLCLHDLMKQDQTYQNQVSQNEIHFPAGSSWIIQTDHVSHAVKQGQYALEQTFYLPIEAMHDEQKSPLRVLEQLLNKKLV